MQEKYSKETFKEYKKFAKEFGIKFYTEDLSEAGFEYNGVSVAFCDSSDAPNCRMLEVSVSYCAPEDKFKPKHGKFHALDKMFRTGETIKVPLAEYQRSWGAKDTGQVLINMFTV